MNFVDTIIGRLGTKPEPFGVADAALVLVAMALLVGVDFALAGTLRKVVASWRRSRADEKRRSDEDDG